MKEWTDTQLAFIRTHLNIDMTAAEIARLFMVVEADVYQAQRTVRAWPGYNHSSPLGLHTPGGGRAFSAFVRGATLADVYEPMAHETFQMMYRPPGWTPPL